MMISKHHRQWKRALSSLALLCYLFHPTVAWAASAETVLDNLSIPRGATIQVISYNAVHNGVQQAVAKFQSPHSVDTVFNHYRTRWAQGRYPQGPAHLEFELPQWRLISRIQDGYSIVLQLNTQKNQQGSTGFISVRAMDTKIVSPHHGLFANLDLLSSHRSVDGADTSLVRVYASALSVDATHRTYKQRLLDAGWSILSDIPVLNSHAMVLTREQARQELTFLTSQEYASVLVVHRVTSE